MDLKKFLQQLAKENDNHFFSDNKDYFFYCIEKINSNLNDYIINLKQIGFNYINPLPEYACFEKYDKNKIFTKNEINVNYKIKDEIHTLKFIIPKNTPVKTIESILKLKKINS